jgi:hypothetical protein
MAPLKQCARDNEQTLIRYLASFDCLTKANIALLLHGSISNSSITYADRITKRLMRAGWLSRKLAGDSIYRYFLADRGAVAAAETLPFLPRAGHDRSYVNATLYDQVDRAIIADMWASDGIGLGRGALRYLLDGKLKKLDGVLTTEKNGNPEFVAFYVRMASLAPNALARFDRCKRLSDLYKVPLKIIGPEFVRKTLKNRR